MIMSKSFTITWLFEWQVYRHAFQYNYNRREMTNVHFVFIDRNFALTFMLPMLLKLYIQPPENIPSYWLIGIYQTFRALCQLWQFSTIFLCLKISQMIQNFLQKSLTRTGSDNKIITVFRIWLADENLTTQPRSLPGK